jgi:hypothetical protein
MQALRLCAPGARAHEIRQYASAVALLDMLEREPGKLTAS